jgi:rRNA-processing protein EBP2
LNNITRVQISQFGTNKLLYIKTMSDNSSSSSDNEDGDTRFSSALSKLRSNLVPPAPSNGDDNVQDRQITEEEKKHHQQIRQESLQALLNHIHSVSSDLVKNDPVESLVMIDNTPLVVQDIEDDRERELAFATIALQSVKRCRTILDEHSIPHIRPNDFMATMLKSDEHMSRIKRRLLVETKAMKVVEQRKNAKKYKARAKQIQQKKVEERNEKKRSNVALASQLHEKKNNEDLDFDDTDKEGRGGKSQPRKKLRRGSGSSSSNSNSPKKKGSSSNNNSPHPKKKKQQRLGKSKRSGGGGKRRK